MRNIDLIILGILATSIMVIGAVMGIAIIIATPVLVGKLVGIVFTATMVITIVGLWKFLLN